MLLFFLKMLGKRLINLRKLFRHSFNSLCYLHRTVNMPSHCTLICVCVFISLVWVFFSLARHPPYLLHSFLITYICYFGGICFVLKSISFDFRPFAGLEPSRFPSEFGGRIIIGLLFVFFSSTNNLLKSMLSL